MTKKIEPDLFARLMQLPAAARRDILEFIGEGPVAVTRSLLRDGDRAGDDGSADRPDTDEPET